MRRSHVELRARRTIAVQHVSDTGHESAEKYRARREQSIRNHEAHLARIAAQPERGGEKNRNG